jgi:hypothetical protein
MPNSGARQVGEEQQCNISTFYWKAMRNFIFGFDSRRPFENTFFVMACLSSRCSSFPHQTHMNPYPRPPPLPPPPTPTPTPNLTPTTIALTLLPYPGLNPSKRHPFRTHTHTQFMSAFVDQTECVRECGRSKKLHPVHKTCCRSCPKHTQTCEGTCTADTCGHVHTHILTNNNAHIHTHTHTHTYTHKHTNTQTHKHTISRTQQTKG